MRAACARHCPCFAQLLSRVGERLAEEGEQRIWEIWQDIYRKVSAVLEEIRDEKGDTPTPDTPSP